MGTTVAIATDVVRHEVHGCVTTISTTDPITTIEVGMQERRDATDDTTIETIITIATITIEETIEGQQTTIIEATETAVTLLDTEVATIEDFTTQAHHTAKDGMLAIEAVVFDTATNPHTDASIHIRMSN